MKTLDAQQPPFVHGQVVTRFAEGTPEREAVERVSQTMPLDLSGLANVTDRMSARAGVPLRIYQLNSGYWVTFEVDRARLPEHVRVKLESQAGVQNVTPTAVPGGDSVVGYTIAVQEGSQLARIVERRNRRDLTQLLASWSVAVGLRLGYEVDDGHLVVTVDWNDSTLELIERFKSFSEIEAAQPNYRMGMMFPG